MKKDAFSSLISITKGIHRDNRTEREYRKLYNELKNDIQFKAAPVNTIEFTEIPFGIKQRYYKLVIDIEAKNKFNQMIESFPENAIDVENNYSYSKLYNIYRKYLFDVRDYINKHNFHKDSILKENTYIIQYLKTSMIWLFMELQERFSIHKSEEEEVLTLEEVYKYYFNEELEEAEIQPSEMGKPIAQLQPEEPKFIAIEGDLPHRPIKKGVLSYKDIVQYPSEFAQAEKLMFESSIIDKDYNFIFNPKKSNKSVLGLIYYLFMEREYFNNIKSNPYKKIKSFHIVRFLNNRYNTNARKQFKKFEGDKLEREELLIKEYWLQNLPFKRR